MSGKSPHEHINDSEDGIGETYSPTYRSMTMVDSGALGGAASMMSQGIDLGSHPNASSFPPSASSGSRVGHWEASCSPGYYSQEHEIIQTTTAEWKRSTSAMSHQQAAEVDKRPASNVWSPFDVPHDDEVAGADSDMPRLIYLPETFRLERTNFVLKTADMAQRPTVDLLLSSLRTALEDAGVDVLVFRPEECLFECSYHKANRFIGLFVRAYLPPHYVGGYGQAQEGSALLVEGQLREGDGLHFSTLFRDVMSLLKVDESVSVEGTLRYDQKVYPDMGECLVLEDPGLAPSSHTKRLLLQKEQRMSSAGSLAAGAGHLPAMYAAGTGLSPPLPPNMAKSCIEFDDDIKEDVEHLAGMLRSNYLDAQADGAAAVAGLTSDGELLEQLCHPHAAQATAALAGSAARLLVETQHRPARRQAAVIVANLCTMSQIRDALLASDPPPDRHNVGIVDALAGLALGDDVRPGTKEEEIGMRRECMRALAGLANDPTARSFPGLKSLVHKDPTGRGATDATLMAHLKVCRETIASA